jgi:hypothetical protein
MSDFNGTARTSTTPRETRRDADDNSGLPSAGRRSQGSGTAVSGTQPVAKSCTSGAAGFEATIGPTVTSSSRSWCTAGATFATRYDNHCAYADQCALEWGSNTTKLSTWATDSETCQVGTRRGISYEAVNSLEHTCSPM